MGRNSVLGADRAPLRPKGTGEDALGPGDGSDSGSDMIGTDELPAADAGMPVDRVVGDDVAFAPIERSDEDGGDDGQGADISVDQVFDLDGEIEAGAAGPIDGAMADDPLDEEDGVDDTPDSPNRPIRSRSTQHG